VAHRELVIRRNHLGAGSLGRSRRRTPGRAVSSVDKLAFTKTLASITLSVRGVPIEFGSPSASVAGEKAIFRVESVGQ